MLIAGFLVGMAGVPAQAGATQNNDPRNTGGGNPNTRNPNPNQRNPNPNQPPPCRSNGCPQASISLALVSITVSDRPVGYAPPVGPEVRFHLTYNQLDTAQPSHPAYSNVGPLWTTDWLAFVSDNPQSLGQNVTVALP
ncbi:MAG: hypothetical protein ACREM8_08895, partial [Vulcanimicrobiaceae bacterium]